MGIDQVLANPPVELRRVLSAIVPEAFHKFDRFGLPAYYMKAGKVNPDLLLKYVTVDDMVQTHLWGQEFSFKRAEEKSKELGRNIDQSKAHNTTQRHTRGHLHHHLSTRCCSHAVCAVRCCCWRVRVLCVSDL